MLILFFVFGTLVRASNCIWSNWLGRYLCFNSCTSSPCNVTCTNDGGEAWCVEDGGGWEDASNGNFCVSSPDTDPYTEWCPEGCECKHYQPKFPWSCWNGCIQSICPTEPPITVTPDPPTCADIVLNISGPSCASNFVNKITFSVSGSLSGHTFNNETDLITGVVSGGDSIDLPGILSITRDLTGNGDIAWTHSWTESNSSGDTINCTKTASKKGLVKYVNPICGNTNPLSASPLPIYNNLGFSLIHNVPINQYDYTFIGDSYSPNISCGATTPSNTNNGSRNCNVVSGGQSQPQEISWTHSWMFKNKNCSFLETSCSSTFTQVTKPNPGYIKTIDGNIYIKGIVNQPNFNLDDKLSTFVFGSESSLQDHLNPLTGKCSDVNNPTCSAHEKQFILNSGYNDANSSLSWFDTLKSKILEMDTESDDIKVNKHENLTTTGTCSGKQIFIVEGNLTINPRFTVSNRDSSCLFLVKGKTTIGNTFEGNSFSSIPYNESDLIEAFIITNDYEDQDDGDDMLVIKGGLIINVKNSFKRATGQISTPSTIIHYEGARYIKHYKDFLSLPQQLTIKEIN